MTFPGGGGIISHMQDGSVSPIGNFFRNKWVRAILVIDVLTIIGVVTVVIYNLTKNAIIDFTIAPIDATITVNGNSNYHNGSFQFHPGTYEVTISHESLDPKTFIIELQPDSDVAITTFLSEDGFFDFYKLKDNYSSYLMLERIASPNNNQTTDNDTSAEDFIANFQESYNLYQTKLPVTYSEYDDNGKLIKYISVRDGHNCTFTLCLITSIYDEKDKDFVKSLLLDAGFNMENFEIEYKIY